MNDLDDARWLVGEAATAWLSRVGDEVDATKLAQRMAREIGAARARLVFEQVELRRRARGKFANADAMFFTRRGLEQATDDVIAAYKASRYPSGAGVVDFCCGVGGDLRALAARGMAMGVDRDPLLALFARANADVDVLCDDATSFDAARHEGIAAWHADPDRRVDERRHTRVEAYEPGPDTVAKWLEGLPDGAIKLAPAAELPAEWSAAEREWIGHQRECKQQVAWFGSLARSPGERRATIVAAGQTVESISGSGDEAAPPCAGVGRYLFDPHAAVIAARLVPALAAAWDVPRVAVELPWLTADRPIESLLAACFEVIETLPFDARRVKAWLRERGVGRLEIKPARIGVNPDELRKKLSPRGDESATLLIGRVGGRVLAIVARRRDSPPTAEFTASPPA